MSQRFVIVGGGQAAAQSVITLRQSGYSGSLMLIGEEPQVPYQRPPLSKRYLAGRFERERLSIRPPSFYQEHDVELELGCRVSSIAPGTRGLSLADGRRLRCDGLLIATGSKVRKLRVPGAELGGVHYLRTIADADALTADLLAGRRIVIVGAGYIGLEVAAVAVELGLDVVVLEAAERVMARTVSADIASFFGALHAGAGVEIRCRARVTRILGEDAVVGVETADGQRIGCDLVLIGIGVEPNATLAREAGLACSDGIVVDRLARTEAAGIVAAGDCTKHPNAMAGRNIRLESVHNAIEQAKTAAASLLGESRPYSQAPWFWSDQYDVKLQIAGLIEPDGTRVVRGSPNDRCFAVFHLAGDRLRAVEAVNSPRDFLAGRTLINAQAPVTAAQLSDPDQDLIQLSRQPAR